MIFFPSYPLTQIISMKRNYFLNDFLYETRGDNRTPTKNLSIFCYCLEHFCYFFSSIVSPVFFFLSFFLFLLFFFVCVLKKKDFDGQLKKMRWTIFTINNNCRWIKVYFQMSVNHIVYHGKCYKSIHNFRFRNIKDTSIFPSNHHIHKKRFKM